MLASSSQMAADDDLFHDTLDLFATSSKKDKDVKVLTKENAKDACSELYAKKNNIDSFEAMDKVRKNFNKVWEQHDIL